MIITMSPSGAYDLRVDNESEEHEKKVLRMNNHYTPSTYMHQEMHETTEHMSMYARFKMVKSILPPYTLFANMAI